MKDCTREEQTEVFLLHWPKTETILGKDQAKSEIIEMNDTPAEWKNIEYKINISAYYYYVMVVRLWVLKSCAEYVKS